MLSTVAQQLYLAYFGRPADVSGLAAFSAELGRFLPQNATIVDLAEATPSSPLALSLVGSFSASQESRDLYTGSTAQLVNSIYLNVLNRPSEPAGLAYWVDRLDNTGLDPARAALEIIAAAVRNGVRDADTVLRKTQVAELFTSSLDSFEELRAYNGNAAAELARNMLARVDADTDLNLFRSEVDFVITDLVNALGDIFNIEFVYQNGTQAFSTVFEQIEERLSGVITKGLPAFTLRNGQVVDDLRITVSQRFVDGASGTLAFAGPDFTRPLSQGGLPYSGNLVIDSADVQGMQAAGVFDDVMLHEIMHVLGAGTLWQARGLTPASGQYTGPAALGIYRQLTGDNTRAFVPVTSDGGHWAENVFRDELLTPTINFSSSVQFSALSIASLADLGYSVDYSRADPYVLPVGVREADAGTALNLFELV